MDFYKVNLNLQWCGCNQEIKGFSSLLIKRKLESRESFEFLKIKIAELMEQYSIFEGLTNLRVSLLMKKDTKVLLPDVRFR